MYFGNVVSLSLYCVHCKFHQDILQSGVKNKKSGGVVWDRGVSKAGNKLHRPILDILCVPERMGTGESGAISKNVSAV